MKMPKWLSSKKSKASQVTIEEKRESFEERVKKQHPTTWKKPPIQRERIIAANFKKTTIPVAHNMAIALDSKAPTSFAMDAVSSNFSLANSDIPDQVLEFFGQHSFIGYQSCAILLQHWIIESACTTPPNDAMAPDFVLSYSDNNKTDAEKSADGSDEEELMDIKNAACEDYNISALCRQFASNKKTFGVALAIPVMDESIDMSLPYNADGIKKGQYKGMAIVEPYWVMPQLDSAAASDPASLNFYEPTWYNVRGKQIHYTWVIKVVNTTLPDILKPTYYYGGVPLPQMIYERVYAAEKTANEAPQLALTKRMLIADADVDNLLANPEEAQEILQAVSYMRNNYGVWFKSPDDQVAQIDTSLTDFDALIMTQFQLVASIAAMPATKLLKTTPKGFNATGDYEWKDYAQSLIAIQEHDFVPVIKRHLELYCKSELGKDIPLTVTFNPVDVPTEKEVAEVEEIDSRVLTNYVNAGVIGNDEVRDILRNDEGGKFSTLSEDAPDSDIDEEAEALADKVDGEEKGGDKKMSGWKVSESGKRYRETESGSRVYDAAEFKESEHPRDNDGKFGSGGGGGSKSYGTSKNSTVSAEYNNGKWCSTSGNTPEHIAKLKIPPKWTGVIISLDPSADVLARGKDSKGREQRIYSEEFTKKSSEKKFARITKLEKTIAKTDKINATNLESDNPSVRDNAEVFALIRSTGIRPGSNVDTKANKKAYGATTLEARHIVEKEDGVHLVFVGKKGVDLDIPVKDKTMSSILLDKKAKKSDNEPIFKTNAAALRSYSKDIGGSDFKPKDLRTYLGTNIAKNEAEKYDKPETQEEYKRIVKDIAIKVSKSLGNTPIIALQSYINPTVFERLKVA